MIFDGSNAFDALKAKERLEWLVYNCKLFELTEKKKLRSVSQNRYLHLILSWYALEYGETLEYIKQEVFKKQINADLFIYEFINKKTGEIRTAYKSTTDLDTYQMTLAIDVFRDYASKIAGIYLPEPKDIAFLQEIEKQIENQKQYL